MLDIKILRQDMVFVCENLQRRSVAFDVDFFQNLEENRKRLQTSVQDMQNSRNQLSKQIGIAKKNGEDVSSLMKQSEQLQESLSQQEYDLSILQEKLNNYLLTIPNLPHASVPYGQHETDNVVCRTHLEPPEFSFEPKEHLDIEAIKRLMSFENAVKLSGSRFVVLQGALSRLHRALAQFMLDTHVEEHGYTETYCPYLVKSDSLQGTGQLPKFEEDLYKIRDQDLWLIPTAEVTLTNLVRDKILDEKELPLRFVAHTPCFRSEAGSYGKDTRGILRQHQFDKVELVQIVHPDKSYEALEELLSHAEKILQKLELPYRVIELCTGDIGFSSSKTYDIEVWLPGQNTYREISSCSNTEAFQARRMQARAKSSQSKKPYFVHTLNGSGLAVGRTLLALLENNQNADGTVNIPPVLRKYMNGLDKIV